MAVTTLSWTTGALMGTFPQGCFVLGMSREDVSNGVSGKTSALGKSSESCLIFGLSTCASAKDILSASNLQASPGPLLFAILQFVALEISAVLSQTEPTFSQHNQARRADGFPHLFCCISHYLHPQLDDRNL